MPRTWIQKYHVKKINSLFPRFNTAILFAAAGLLAAFSLRWPVMNDLALNLYKGFLVSAFHYVPYRDFFDINAPGTLFIYSFIHRISNGSDLVCRIIDLTLLAGLSLCTVFLLRPFGKKVATASTLVFSIMYLGMGPFQSMQREYVALLPLALALVMAFRLPRMPVFMRSIIIGLFFGIASSIKPLLVIYLPFLLFFTSMRWTDPLKRAGSVYSKMWPYFIWAGVGFACVWFAFFIYFGIHGTIGSFMEFAGQYWPLYNKLDESGYAHAHVPVLAWSRWTKTFPFINAVPFFSLFVLGAVLLPFQKMGREEKFEVGALLAMVLCFFVYIPLTNKFWLYHWIPLYYGLSLFTGFAIQAGATVVSGLRIPVLISVFTVISIPFGFLAEEVSMAKRHQFHVVNEGDVEEIQLFLQSRMDKETTVLPLDVVSGAIHGMYRVKTRLAGRFIHDFYYYHHTDKPIIQKFRRELLQTLADHPPQFIIRVHDTWRPIGPYSDRSFPELECILETQYEPALNSKRFVILQRKPKGQDP
jgi:hypothetical protein